MDTASYWHDPSGHERTIPKANEGLSLGHRRPAVLGLTSGGTGFVMKASDDYGLQSIFSVVWPMAVFGCLVGVVFPRWAPYGIGLMAVLPLVALFWVAWISRKTDPRLTLCVVLVFCVLAGLIFS